MNRGNIIGRLVADVKIFDKVATFTVAVNGKPNKEGKVYTDFISCKMFGEKAVAFAESYLKKGKNYLFSGKLRGGSYTNKDGETVYEQYFGVEEVEFLQGTGSLKENGESGENESSGDGFEGVPDSDVPEFLQ